MIWLPIATAPRDGAEILLRDGTRRRVARWGYSNRFEMPPEEWTTGEPHGWQDIRDTVDAPTHWLQLPEPPP